MTFDPPFLPLAIAALSAGVLGFAVPAISQEEEKSIADWIEQLGADRVRIRDEAEDFLRKKPDAHEALAEAAESAANAEIRVRAENIFRFLQRNHRWKLVATRAAHTPGIVVMNRGLAVTPDQTKFFTRGRDFVRRFDTKTLEPGKTFGDESIKVPEALLREAVVNTLTVSPDGKRVVSTNEYGEVIIHDVELLLEVSRFSVPEAEGFIERGAPFKPGMIFSAAYFSDNKRLITGVHSGIRLWNTDTWEEVWSVSLEGHGFAVVVSPDQSKVIVSVDTRKVQDLLVTFDAKTGEQLAVTATPFRLGGLVFDSSGKKLLADARDGLARIYEYSPGDGSFGIPRTYGPNGRLSQGVAWGPDETTILASSSQKEAVLMEWDVKTGKQIWQAPAFPMGLRNLAWISGNRLVASGENGLVTVWQFTDL